MIIASFGQIHTNSIIKIVFKQTDNDDNDTTTDNEDDDRNFNKENSIIQAIQKHKAIAAYDTSQGERAMAG